MPTSKLHAPLGASTSMSFLCPPRARFWMEPNGTEWNRAEQRIQQIQRSERKGASCLEFFFALNRVRVPPWTPQLVEVAKVFTAKIVGCP